jgi:hypothetical protein
MGRRVILALDSVRNIDRADGRLECSEYPIPQRVDGPEVGVGALRPARMVQPVQVGDDHDQSLARVDVARQADIGVADDGGEQRLRAIDREGHRIGTERGGGQSHGGEGDDVLARMQAHRRGDLDNQVAVVQPV